MVELKNSDLHRIVLYYPGGQKFARNRSISYGFRDIHTFSFSIKSKMPAKSGENLNFFPFRIGHSCTTLWVKNSLEIALSLTIFEIFTPFHFPQKSKMAAKSGKIKIFPFCMGHSCTTLWVKNSLEIALSLTVFKIFTLFHFLQKSKMATKSGEN